MNISKVNSKIQEQRCINQMVCQESQIEINPNDIHNPPHTWTVDIILS